MLTRRAMLLAGASAPVAGLAMPTVVSAQTDWKPTRPVRLIIPFAAGTSMDPVARAVQASLEASLGQPIVVENMGGAATVLAGAETLRSAPDGYTTMMIANSFAANVTLRASRTADWPRLFAPIVQATVVPHVLTLAPSVKADWQSFVQRLKGGEPMTYGSPGIGTSPHLGTEHFMRLIGGKAAHAPYNGTSQLFVDLVGDRIQFALSNLPDIVQFVKEKKLAALAVTSEKRVQELPDVPTFGEVGLPDILSDSWFGIIMRRDTPEPARAAMEKAWLTALTRPDVKERLEALSFTVLARPSPDFEKVIERYTATYATIIRETGISVQQ